MTTPVKIGCLMLASASLATAASPHPPQLHRLIPEVSLAADGQSHAYDIRQVCGIKTAPSTQVHIQALSSDNGGAMAILGPTTVELQSVKAHKAPVYTVEFVATDAAGNISFDRCHFRVLSTVGF